MAMDAHRDYTVEEEKSAKERSMGISKQSNEKLDKIFGKFREHQLERHPGEISEADIESIFVHFVDGAMEDNFGIPAEDD